MARLPVLQKRRLSKAQQAQKAIDTAASLAKAWVLLRATAVSAKAARKGTKAYGTAKGAKRVSRPVIKVLAVPALAGGAALVWYKVRASSNGDGPERPLGPVASADSVSPPAARSDAGGSLTDPPAGATNPPVQQTPPS